MIKSKMLLAISFVLFSGCCTNGVVEVPNITAYVTLPASGDGFGLKTVSKEENIIPKEDWDLLRRRGVTLLPEDYAQLRATIRRNCITNRCTQMLGALDHLFLTIDEALKKVPY